MSEAETEDFQRCPVCGHDSFIVIKDLERHEMPLKQAYEVLECYHCHAFVKAIWKFEKIVELREVK